MDVKRTVLAGMQQRACRKAALPFYIRCRLRQMGQRRGLSSARCDGVLT